MSEEQQPEPGLYRHYKGGVYQVLGIATHTETEESLVVYRDAERLWVRPLVMWREAVTVDGQAVTRFTRLIPAEDVDPTDLEFIASRPSADLLALEKALQERERNDEADVPTLARRLQAAVYRAQVLHEIGAELARRKASPQPEGA